MLLALLGASLATAGDASLTVEMRGFEHANGGALVALYDDPRAYPTKPERAVRRGRATIEGTRATVRFDRLEPGTYAVAVFHDENGNGKLDTNWIGIPNEGLGASNDATGFMGPPSFASAKIEVHEQTTTTITIAY